MITFINIECIEKYDYYYQKGIELFVLSGYSKLVVLVDYVY